LDDKTKIMAKKKEQKVEPQITDSVTNPQPTITLNVDKYEHCEWCYQFDNEEPQIFAWTDDTIDSTDEPKVTFTIGNQKEAYITFSSPNGRTFKLFPRELSEAGKEMREQSKLKIQ
jgi:hypothetical protein